MLGCVLVFMNTDILSPVRGEDTEGEGHWWLIDNNNGDIIDLTKDQYQTNELNGVYSLGKKRGYYGSFQKTSKSFLSFDAKSSTNIKSIRN